MLIVCGLFVIFAMAVLDLMWDDGVIHTIGHKVWPMQWNRWFHVRGDFEHDGWILAEDRSGLEHIEHNIIDERTAHTDYEEVI